MVHHATTGGRLLNHSVDLSRLSAIPQEMPGPPGANYYKMIQPLLKGAELREALLRLYQEDAPFILAYPTEIPRPQAKKTEYVGRSKDGKTRGFQILSFAVPYRGRATPQFITYSSRAIGDAGCSRNLEHQRALAELKELIREKPVVLDREFSYEGLSQDFVAEGMKFVIRLNLGHHLTLRNAEGRRSSSQ